MHSNGFFSVSCNHNSYSCALVPVAATTTATTWAYLDIPRV